MRKEKGLLGPLTVCLALLFLLTPRGERSSAVRANGEARMEEPRQLMALTFDDGPGRTTTPALLDGLAQRGVKATFFLVGENLSGNEELVRRMEAEGHQIGIHGYDHVRLTRLNAADFHAQVDRTARELAAILGREGPFLLRPPYGAVDDGLKNHAGSALILWSVDPEDWRVRDAQEITSHVVTHAGDGDIILLHDIHPATVTAALDIVDILHEKGVIFVTVDELAGERHTPLQRGEVYRCFR